MLAVAALFVVAGVVTGCERTTPGTVAMTTEPGASLSTSSPRTTSPRTRSPRTSTDATPPSAAASTTCTDYVAMDPADQAALVEQILAEDDSVFAPQDSDLAKTLVDAMCLLLPNSVVGGILTGETP